MFYRRDFYHYSYSVTEFLCSTTSSPLAILDMHFINKLSFDTSLPLTNISSTCYIDRKTEENSKRTKQGVHYMERVKSLDIDILLTYLGKHS